MKTLYLLLCLCMLEFTTVAQGNDAIGIDVSGNIPTVFGFKGVNLGLIYQREINPNKFFEYGIGFANYGLPSQPVQSYNLQGKQAQMSKGLYVSFGKKRRNDGWQLVVSYFDVTNTLNLMDNDFNVPYTYTFPKEKMLYLGGSVFFDYPIRINDRIRSNIRLIYSMSVGNNPLRHGKYVLYTPGFGIVMPPIKNITFGVGVTVPLFIKLKSTKI